MKQSKFLSLLLAALFLLTACKASPLTALSTPPPSTTSLPTNAAPTPDGYDPSTEQSVQVVYMAAFGGTISGRLSQTLTPERPTCSAVVAVPDVGWRFCGWSDGSTDPLRKGDSYSENALLTAYFEKDILELPAISITVPIAAEDIPRYDYIEGSVSVEGCADEYRIDDLATEIRGRGHGSWTYDKKGWKLKLSESQAMLGLGQGRSREWVLVANHVDRSLLRNAAATWIQRVLGLSYVADYAFVDLYLNGEYMGVYQLYEQIEEDENKVSILPGSADDVSYLVELSVHAEEHRFTVHSDPYELLSKLPAQDSEAYLQAVDAHLTQCLVAVKAGDQEEIARLIDLNSVVNAYLVEELTKNRDPGWDSFYLYRQPGGKLTFGPLWDFDMSSGNVQADESSVCHNTFQFPDGLYAGNTAAASDRQQNVWFSTLAQYDWFWELVRTRWQRLPTVWRRCPICFGRPAMGIAMPLPAILKSGISSAPSYPPRRR